MIVLDEFTIGRSGPWLVILNNACSHYKVFAMEFNKSYNPEFGDPNKDHVGINLGSAVSFKTENSSKVNVSLHNTTIAYRAMIVNVDGSRSILDWTLSLNLHNLYYLCR